MTLLLLTGTCQVDQLQLKPRIIDAANLPFTCESGKVTSDVLGTVCFSKPFQGIQLKCVSAASIGHAHVHWPWWRGFKMCIVVSGVEVQGITRVHPQVSFPSHASCIGGVSNQYHARLWHML